MNVTVKNDLFLTLSADLTCQPSSGSLENGAVVSGYAPSLISSDKMVSCHQLMETNMTFSNAESTCKAAGGALVTIESKEEEEYISKMIWRKTSRYFNVFWYSLHLSEFPSSNILYVILLK